MGIFDAINDDLKNKSTDKKIVDNKINVEKSNEINAPVNEVYIVKKGDTLGGIAKHFYGSAAKYMVIFEHNKQVWIDHGKKADPNVIFPGWQFEIPKL